MEPIDIDWKNINSRFIQDDLYEHMSAPKWFDFSAPDESVDDEAWFCRPDCRHPKCYDDFKVKSDPEIVPLGDRNRRDTTLKRRGILSTIPGLRDFNKPDKTPIKPPRKFREDTENENPNCNTSPLNPSPKRPITSSKILKESIKSSAEKPRKKTSQSSADSVTESSPLEEKTKLRSTLSARNLFAGREILNQVSEFCSDLKKLALNVTEREKRKKKKKEEEPLLEAKNSNSKEEENSSSKIFFSPEASKKSTREDKRTVSKEAGKVEQCILQVRSCPPSPQRFPSPYNRNKLTKTTSLKPPKSRTTPVRGILQEVVVKEPAVVDSEENKKISISSTEGRTLDMLWFLKPCTLNLGE